LLAAALKEARLQAIITTTGPRFHILGAYI